MTQCHESLVFTHITCLMPFGRWGSAHWNLSGTVVVRIKAPKEIQPVHSEGDQPWDFFGGNDAEAETPVLWPPHAKS